MSSAAVTVSDMRAVLMLAAAMSHASRPDRDSTFDEHIEHVRDLTAPVLSDTDLRDLASLLVNFRDGP